MRFPWHFFPAESALMSEGQRLRTPARPRQPDLV